MYMFKQSKVYIIKLSFPKLNAAHRIHFFAWQRSTLAERKFDYHRR